MEEKYILEDLLLLSLTFLPLATTTNGPGYFADDR
jgi:hypothetical protein